MILDGLDLLRLLGAGVLLWGIVHQVRRVRQLRRQRRLTLITPPRQRAVILPFPTERTRAS